MTALKVAHVTTIDMSLYHLLLGQMQSLQRAGYAVSGISSAGPYVGALEAAGIPHIAIDVNRKPFDPAGDLKSLWQLYRVYRRERFSLVHTHTPKAGILGRLAARLARVPVVLHTVHGFYFDERAPGMRRHLYTTLEKVAARCSDLVLSQNREDIERTVRLGICPRAKIEYLGNGIDLGCFSRNRLTPAEIQQKRAELGLTADDRVVGFVGRLAAQRKGFLSFLAAAREVVRQAPGTRFLIVGDTDYGRPDAVDPSVARDYGIAKHCLFLGWRPNSELPLLYAQMDALVLPSLWEGVPRAVMEASAMEVPTVVTDVPGNREAVAHGRNGLLVPVGDVDALASAVVTILRDRPAAERMAAEGRRIAEAHFDEQQVFARVHATYAHLLAQKRLERPRSLSTRLEGA
jgi:glycosyltransferase involved in cell wall biosynthesis